MHPYHLYRSYETASFTTTDVQIQQRDSRQLKRDTRKKKIAILERKSEFPIKLRDLIDEAKEERQRYFLWKIRDKLMKILEGNFNTHPPYSDLHDKTNGLDSDRDTEEEIKVAVRFFPEVISDSASYQPDPIYKQLMADFDDNYNVKALSFIPVLAELGIELGGFVYPCRGGLVAYGTNMLVLFARNEPVRSEDEEHQQFVDETLLAVMKQLRQRVL